jgi:hypothetical protein
VRVTGTVAAFLVALVAATTAIDAAAPVNPAGSPANEVFHKLDFLLGHLGDYDVVYVGSSRTRRAFDPALFDAELARRGIHVRSFNLGIPGTRAFAQEDLVRRLLRADTSRLKLVIIAPEALETDLTPDRAHADRQVLWHDVRRTFAALKAVAQSPAGVRDRTTWARGHVESFLLNVTGAGRLSNRFNYRVGTDDAEILGPRGDGFSPIPIVETDQARLTQRVADVVLAERKPAPRPTRAELAFVARVSTRLRRHGIGVAFVREPILFTARTRFLRWFHDNDPSAPVVDLGNPFGHPGLFRPRLFHDAGHLDATGAYVFTRVLARELLPLLDGGA